MQAAIVACSAQGLTQGTDAFAHCVQTQLGSGQGSAPETPTSTACAADFEDCLKDETTTSGPVSASDQAAIDGCKASGIKQRTDAFKSCVAAASAAASVSGWTGEQLAAYNACKAAGNAFPSAAFASCLSKVLTKIVPSKSAGTSVKDVEAAAAVCSTNKFVGTPFLQCIKDHVSAP